MTDFSYILYDSSHHCLLRQEEDEEAAGEDQGYDMGAPLPNGWMHL